MEDAFGFTETVDQMTAIAEVKGDMEKPSPMDRVICGDVGYGKTEIAVPRGVQGRAGRQAGRGAGAHDAAGPTSTRRPSPRGWPASRSSVRVCPGSPIRRQSKAVWSRV